MRLHRVPILSAALFALSAALILLPLATAQISTESPAPPEISAPVTSITTASLPRTYPVINGSLLVAPGLVLPNGNLPWALDNFAGKDVLIPLHHATLQITDTAQSGNLPGAHSPNVLHAATPIFFIHTSDRTENAHDAGRPNARPLWTLLPVTSAGTSRTFTRPAHGDQPPSDGCAASTVCTTIEALPDGWLRIISASPLTPGDYVLIPATRPASKAAVAVVYDFTVDPAGPLAKETVQPGVDLQPRRRKK